MGIFFGLSIFEILMLILLMFHLKGPGVRGFVLSPVSCFILFATFIYIFNPIIFSAYLPKFNFREGYAIDTKILANLYSLSYILTVVASYMLLGGNHYFPSKDIGLRPITKKENWYLMGLLLISLFCGYLFLKIIFSMSWAEYMTQRIEAREGKGGIIIGFSFSYLIFFIYLSNYLAKSNTTASKTRNRLFKSFEVVSLIFLFVLIIAVTLISGNRLTVLIVFIFILISFVLFYRRSVKLKSYLIGALGVYALASILTLAGAARHQANAIEEGGLSALQEASGEKSFGESFAFGMVSSLGSIENLYWLIENKAYWQECNGQTFLAGLVNPVPRVLWPDKPLGGGPALKNMIEPGSYYLGKKKRSSYTTGIIPESFMNFYYFGFIPIGFLHGLCLFLLRLFALHLHKGIIPVALYANVLIGLSLMFLFGEFLGIYTRILITSLPFVLIYFISRIRTT